MTKKEFFLKKIIPQIEEQIFNYDFQLIRNQYILERLNEELQQFEKDSILPVGEDPEKILKERIKKKNELQKQIEEIQRNIDYLPVMKKEEERFLKYFKDLIEKI